MELINYTPFPALNYEMIDGNDNAHHVVVMRATFMIRTDGTLSVADEQLPPVTRDEYYGELNKSSVKQESDLAPYKPLCDVNVIATAYSPWGKPAKRFVAGIRIYEKLARRELPPRPYGHNPTMPPTPEKLAAWEKEVAAIKANPFAPVGLIRSKLLIVNGPRYWEKGVILGGWKLTKSKPITQWPIRYEYAYGGENQIKLSEPAAKKVPAKHRLIPEQRAQHPDGPDKAPVAHTVCGANPLGRGYFEQWYLKAMNGGIIGAPLIESPDDPVKEFGKAHAPQGLGIIGRAWQPRIKLAGTYDEEWLKKHQGQPSLPEDFDFAYWNGAHPDLQTPYLKGDEVIELINLCPYNRHNAIGRKYDQYGNRIVRFSLPSRRIRLTLESENGRFDSIDMNIDTLIIEPDEERVSVVWRGTLPFSAAIAFAKAQVRSVQKEAKTKE